ncbi:MAG: hypothetical protein RIS35_2074 [Pseudomonadota bacterium]|jgi:hypothetical protein
MDSRRARILLALAAGLTLSTVAWAHGGPGASRGPIRHGTVSIGAHWGPGPAVVTRYRAGPIVPRFRPSPVVFYGTFGPAWSYPLHGPLYYPGYVERPVYVPVQPPTYIQQQGAEGSPLAPGYWYWCPAPEGYYPSVPECPQGWVPVPPRSDPTEVKP